MSRKTSPPGLIASVCNGSSFNIGLGDALTNVGASADRTGRHRGHLNAGVF
jgi:hypothetical protein